MRSRSSSAAQIAASSILVIVSALLVRALDHAVTTSPGFEYEQVVSIDLGLPRRLRRPARNLSQHLAEPAARSSGSRVCIHDFQRAFGQPKVSYGCGHRADDRSTCTCTLSIRNSSTPWRPPLRGRNFTNSDTHAVIISKSFAVQWPDRDALGRPFQMGDTSYTVIGIAGSARLVAIQDPDAVEAYYLASNADLPSIVVLLSELLDRQKA